MLQACVTLRSDWSGSWNGAAANLEEQLADLVFALGGGFMQGRELPQVGHIDRGAVSDQQLGHLVVSVGAGVVEGDQPAAGRTQRYCAALLWAFTASLHRHANALKHASHPLSLACTSAPWCSRYSTTDTLL